MTPTGRLAVGTFALLVAVIAAWRGESFPMAAFGMLAGYQVARLMEPR